MIQLIIKYSADNVERGLYLWCLQEYVLLLKRPARVKSKCSLAHVIHNSLWKPQKLNGGKNQHFLQRETNGFNTMKLCHVCSTEVASKWPLKGCNAR